MWTLPLRRDPVGYYGHPLDHGGIRPKKPEGAKRLGFSDELWRTVERCWREDRNARPNIASILSSLNEAKAFWDVRDS
jgi:hypothetical protein